MFNDSLKFNILLLTFKVKTDGSLANVTSKSIMEQNGWKVDVEYSNEKPYNLEYEQNCSSNTFYGHRHGVGIWKVSATFRGSGKGILTYGNCYKNGYVAVHLNGVELARASANRRDSVAFPYRRGDILSIEGQYDGIIKLYSLEIEESCKYILTHLCHKI